MAPVKKIVAGARLTFAGFVDTLGFLMGGSTTAPSNGSGSGMLQILGIQQAPFAVQEGEAVNVPGDDGVLGQFLFDPDALPEFIVNFGAFDLQQDALMQGTLVESFGRGYIGVMQPKDPAYPDVCLIIQGLAKSKDSGSDGVSAYDIYIFPVCTVQPLGRESAEGRTAGVNRWKVTPNLASKKPWGVTITDAVNGTTAAPILPASFDNPITMHRYTGTGAGGQSVILDKTPVSLAGIVVVDNTAVLTPTTDYTLSGKTLTWVTNRPAGSKTIIIYEFTP